MKNIAIIPARGGSKRIPKKNIRSFYGFPVIMYSIEAALNSGCFSEVMVSTDDDEIAEVARRFGARVPFKRSALNSNDQASTADVLLEVISQYKDAGKVWDFFCCLYPAAPLITPQKIKKGYQLMIESGADSLIPVVKFSYPIQRALSVEKGRLFRVEPKYSESRSQDLPARYHDAGQFYWAKTSSFLTEKQLLMKNTVPMEVLETEVQDIDNEMDWQIAELKDQLMMRNK